MSKPVVKIIYREFRPGRFADLDNPDVMTHPPHWYVRFEWSCDDAFRAGDVYLEGITEEADEREIEKLII